MGIRPGDSTTGGPALPDYLGRGGWGAECGNCREARGEPPHRAAVAQAGARARHRGGLADRPRAGAQAAVRSSHARADQDRKSTRLNSSHSQISYAVFCLKKKKRNRTCDHTSFHTRSRVLQVSVQFLSRVLHCQASDILLVSSNSFILTYTYVLQYAQPTL